MNSTDERLHVLSSIVVENSAPLTCSICGKQFSNEKRYFGHLRIHSGQVSWCCERCPSSRVPFDSQSRLKNHENTCHTLVRPHECSKCDSVFDRASQLDYHRRSVHMREKSQICQICGKGFFRKNDLQTHLNVHLGTNQSICEICGRKFNHVSNLIRHCRTHAGSKPYPCTICGKRFTQTSSLARHKLVHQREIKDISDSEKNCEKMYNEESKNCQDSSKFEIQRKITKRQHYCQICGESFRFMVLLRQHKKIHGKIRETMNVGLSSSIDDWQNFEEDKIISTNDNVENSTQHDSANNSIDNNLMELAVKINSIEIETERDVSISDILSPYNCNESSSDNIETNFYETSTTSKENLVKDYDIVQCLNGVHFQSNVSSQLSDDSTSLKSPTKSITKISSKRSKMEKLSNLPRDRLHGSLPAEDSQLYGEICESVYLKNSNVRHSELEEIQTRVDEFREDRFVPSDERTKSEKMDLQLEARFMKKNDQHTDLRRQEEAENDDKESTMRLVNTEMGEQFYELIVNNNRCNDFESEHFPRNNEEFISHIVKTAESERLFISEDNCRKFEKQNYDKSTNDTGSSEFLQFSSNIENHRDVENSTDNDDNQTTPMVRLVQNEDGEQFFELVREPLEYVKNRIIDEKSKNSSISGPTNDKSNISRGGTKGQTEIVMNTGLKREKREISTENGEKLAKERTRKFKCNECDKSFSTSYNFKQHAGTHFFDQQKFHCKHCGQSFAWKSTLNKHLAGNHRPDGPQKFVCEICPKVYSTLSQVNEHVKRDHLKERNHVCTLCDKSFFKKFDLKTHSRTHTNERPYICKACGKGFHHQSHIIRHERIHSGERPYECNICQRTFTQPGSLKSHRQRRHRDVKIDILEYRMDEDDPLTLGCVQ